MTWFPPMTVSLKAGGHSPDEMVKRAEGFVRDFFGDAPAVSLLSITDLDLPIEFPMATLTFSVEYPDPIYDT